MSLPNASLLELQALLPPRYQLVRELGSGGESRVFEASDSELQKNVALKIVEAGAAISSEVAQHEFRTLLQLAHPGIVHVHDFGFLSKHRSFFTQELLHGVSITEYFHRAFDARIFESLLLQMSDALEYVHAHGVLHGDLKPENILVLHRVEKNPIVQIIDFGMSAIIGRAASMLSGTIEYMSPEMIRSSETDARSDFYSLGIILYEIVFGVPPFRSHQATDVLRMHLVDQPSFDQPFHSVSPWVMELIASLLVKEPSERAHSSDTIRRALHPDATSIQKEFSTHKGTMRSLPFIGRMDEKKRFEAFLREHPQGATVAITGAPGVGRSRVLRECRVHLQLDRYTVISFTAERFAKDFTLQMQTIARAFYEAGVLPSSTLAIMDDRFDQLREKYENKTTDAEHTERRLVDYFIDALVDHATTTSFALLLDDYDALDEKLRDVFMNLVRVLRERNPGKNVFVYTARSADVVADHFGDSFLELNLRPFDAEESRRCIHAMLSSSGSAASIEEQLLRRIHEFSSGNAHDLVQFTKHLLENEFISITDGVWKFREGLDGMSIIPDTFQELSRQRLAKRSSEDKRILEVLSMVNIPISIGQLVPIVSLPADRVVEIVLPLCKKDFLSETNSRFSFAHRTLKEIVRGEIASGEAEKISRALAEMFRTSMLAYEREEAAVLFESLQEIESASREYLAASSRYYAGLHFNAVEKILTRMLRDETFALTNADRCEALGLLANVFKRTGRYSDFAEVSEELNHLYREQHEDDHLAEILAQEAEIFSTLGQIDRAERAAEKSLQLATKNALPLQSAAALVQLGVVQYHRGKYPDALKSYEQAITLYSDHGEELRAANVLLNAGYAATFTISPDEGISYFQRAREIFVQREDDYGKARALGNLGVALYLMSQYKRSLDVRLEANEIFRQLYDKRGQANAEVSIGKVLMTLDRYTESEQHLTHALRLMREIGDRIGEARCDENLGLLAIETGRYDAALHFFSNALEIGRSLQNVNIIAENYQNRASTFLAQRDFSSCENELLRIQELQSEISDQDTLMNIEVVRLMLFVYRRTDADIQKAAALSDRLARAIESRSNESQKIWLLALKAELLLAKNDSYGGYAASLSAVQKLSEIGFCEWSTQEIYFIHHRSCRAVGKNVEARDHLKQAYDALQRKAESCEDADRRRSFLERVERNASIVAAFAETLEHPISTERVLSDEKSLGAIYKIAATINSILELDVLLPRILDFAIETLSGERGMIFLLEENTLVLHAARNVDKQTVQDATEISESVIQDVVQFGKPLIVENAQEHSAFRSRQSVRNFLISSIICVPLRLKEKIIGTVYIDRRSGFLVQEISNRLNIEFLEAFANLAVIAIENARMHNRLQQENQYLRRQVEEQFGFANIVGRSPKMLAMYRMMKGAMQSDSPALISGESGTGKELVARAIHFHGKRREKKFIAVDCGALPESLLESELFGHAKGAFTGAVAERIGLFEEAHHGTIFLDEITNTSASFQAKLLRILQEGEFRRVGDSGLRMVDVRVIAASNIAIDEEVRSGRFRQDLFYRLNVIPIFVPALRERREDIPILIDHLVKKIVSQTGKNIIGVSEDLVRELTRIDWQGNVRELENVLHRMIVFSERDILSRNDFIFDVTGSTADAEMRPVLSLVHPPSSLSLMEMERNHILEVIRQSNGNKTEAAKKLLLKRTTLLKKMKKLGIG